MSVTRFRLSRLCINSPTGLAVVLPFLLACTGPKLGSMSTAQLTGQARDDEPVYDVSPTDDANAGGKITVSPLHEPAPDIFKATGLATWDGRRTLKGIWVAHPAATSARRVRIFNVTNGSAVDGALFKRDVALDGYPVLISSDAAEALGMVVGEPTDLRIVAVRSTGTPGGGGASGGPVAASDDAGEVAATTDPTAAEPTAPASAPEKTPPPQPVARPADFAATVAAPDESAETSDAPEEETTAQVGAEDTSEDTAADQGALPSDPEIASTDTPESETSDTAAAVPAGILPTDRTFKLFPRPVPAPRQATPAIEAATPEAIVAEDRGLETPAEESGAGGIEATETAATEIAATETAATEIAATETAATETAAAEPSATETPATEEPVTEESVTEEPEAEEAPAREVAANDPAEARGPAPEKPDAAVSNTEEIVTAATPAAGGSPANRAGKPASALPSRLAEPYVQAGLFAVEENALKLVAQLNAKGIPALRKIYRSHARTLSRVLAGPFLTTDERDQAQAAIRGMGLRDAVPVRR